MSGLLPVILFVFWLILTGCFNAKCIVIGLAASLLIAHWCAPILALPAVHTRGKNYAAFALPYKQLVPYLFWLFAELVKANIQVALIVLNPKMPLDPQVVTFRKELDHPVAHTILANSITLTPGTITMDVADDLYTIHALTEDAAFSLAPVQGEGEMPLHVARLFGE